MKTCNELGIRAQQALYQQYRLVTSVAVDGRTMTGDGEGSGFGLVRDVYDDHHGR